MSACQVCKYEALPVGDDSILLEPTQVVISDSAERKRESGSVAANFLQVRRGDGCWRRQLSIAIWTVHYHVSPPQRSSD